LLIIRGNDILAAPRECICANAWLNIDINKYKEKMVIKEYVVALQARCCMTIQRG
jgi:hypothetical protein